MWRDLRSVFACLSASHDCRVIILTGAGKGFTSGLDIHDHIDLFAQNSQAGSDAARQALAKLPLITAYQDSISSLERARVPVIAAIHGACVGGGVDLICAADIRCVVCIIVSGAPSLHWHSAVLQIGVLRRLVQHNGDSTRPRGGCRHSAGACPAVSSHVLHPTHTHASRPMQRLPRIIGNSSVAREWAYTSRRVSAEEVHRLHRTGTLTCLIPSLTGSSSRSPEQVYTLHLHAITRRFLPPSRSVHNSHADLQATPFSFTASFMLYRRCCGNLRSQARALALAKEIAGNSPVAVAGTKANLNYSRCERAGRNEWRAFTRSYFTRGVGVFTFCAPEAADGAPSCPN
jgi:enoyl-CoA hydratase/carnithine racemase